MPTKSWAHDMHRTEYRLTTFSLGLGLVLTTALACAAPQQALTAAEPFYVELDGSGGHGLGFLADGRTLFTGGCRVFDLNTRNFEPQCRFPANTRWGHVSADGRLLLATALDPKTKVATSFQINALDGKILSTKSGIHFAPPIAIHPNNAIWAAVLAGREPQASETIEVIGRDWATIRKGVYGNTRRIFDLKFSSDGAALLVNGGAPDDGAQQSTKDWSPVGSPLLVDPSVLSTSPDGTISARLRGRSIVVFNTTSQAPMVTLHVDASLEEPQLSFSPDGRWFTAKGILSQGSVRRFAIGIVNLRAEIERSQRHVRGDMTLDKAGLTLTWHGASKVPQTCTLTDPALKA